MSQLCAGGQGRTSHISRPGYGVWYRYACDDFPVCPGLGNLFAKSAHPSTLDVGTGTGILSNIATRLGARSALGTDIDPVAVHNSIENAQRNNVGHLFSCNEDLPINVGPYTMS